MKKALLQLLLSLIALVAVVILYVFDPAWSILGILIVPAVALAWVDLGRALRKTPSSNVTPYALGVLVGVPQAVFGLVCLIAGISIIVAFFFWPARGEGSNWTILFVAPILAFFGIWWLRDSFKRGQAKSEGKSV